MSEAIGLALAQPGLGWLLLTIGVAGLIRGFTGFGTAMIFMPIAVQFLTVPEAILIMALTGVASGAALLPKAWHTGDRKEVASLAIAASVTVPIGLALIDWFDPRSLRWLVAGLISLTLLALITGWRYHGRLGLPGRFAVGGGAGLVGGLTGLTGPVVIVFYLANARSAETVRANVILFLAGLDLVMILGILWGGLVTAQIFWIAALLTGPYVIMVMVGQRLFDPARESLYRWAAYIVVAGAVLAGLPLFD